jgi:hypothetical protein
MNKIYITTAPVVDYKSETRLEKDKSNERNVWWCNGTSITLQLKGGLRDTIWVEHDEDMNIREGHVFSVIRNKSGELLSVTNHNTMRHYHQCSANRVDKRMLFTGIILTFLLFPLGLMVLLYQLFIRKYMISKAKERYEEEMRMYSVKESRRIDYLKLFGLYQVKSPNS